MVELDPVGAAIKRGAHEDAVFGCRYVLDSDGRLCVLRRGELGFEDAYLTKAAARAAYYLPGMTDCLAASALDDGVSVTELTRAYQALSQVEHDGRPVGIQRAGLSVSVGEMTVEQQRARIVAIIQLGAQRALGDGREDDGECSELECE